MQKRKKLERLNRLIKHNEDLGYLPSVDQLIQKRDIEKDLKREAKLESNRRIREGRYKMLGKTTFKRFNMREPIG